MPYPDFGFLSEGLWGPEYRDAGGVNVADFYARAQEQQPFADAPLDLEPPAAAQELMPEEAFVDWPTYQREYATRTDARSAYDDYVGNALPWQLKQMGYSDEEIAQEVQAFGRMVQPPAQDLGFFGNLWESAKGGVASGTRAERAAGNLVAGDLDAIAKLVTEQASGSQTAPVKQFYEAIGTDEAKGDIWEAIKAYANATWNNPQGAVDFLAEQAAQSYPVIAIGGAGALAGSAASPVGAIVGGILGVGAGSASLEVGSQILERIATAAQERGVDARDPAAIRALIADPDVYNELRDAALAKGLTVGAADAAVSAVSLGLGKYAAGAARAGQRGRAAGAAVGGLGAESLGGAAGEALSQVAAGDELNFSEIVGEAFGELGPGAANLAIGAMLPGQRRAPPGPPVTEEDIAEGDLPAAGGGALPGYEVTEIPGSVEEINIGVPPADEEITIGDIPTEPAPSAAGIEVQELPEPQIEVVEPTVEEITLNPVAAVQSVIDSAEQRIAEGRLLTFQPNPPLVAGTAGVGTPAQMEAQRLQGLAPQPAELNVKDPENVAQWLDDRGVALTPSQHAIVEDLAGTPPRQRRTYIASVIDDLTTSADENAEQLAEGLLAIARSLPKDPVTATPAQAAQKLAVDLGIPANQVIPTITSALAKEVQAHIEAGVLSEPTTELVETPSGSVEVPVQTKRGLRRGEPIPGGGGLSGLLDQIAGSAARGRAEGNQEQPGGGVPAVGRQEGAGKRGKSLRRGKAAAAVGGGESAPTVTNNPAGAPGVPRIIIGERPPSTVKEQQRRRDTDVVIMDKEEYEQAYPGRNYEKDLDALLKAGDAREGDVRTLGQESMHVIHDGVALDLQYKTATEIMNWLASVSPNPLARIVAREIAALNLPTKFVLRNMQLAGAYVYDVDRGGKNDLVLINPWTGRTLETILHEFVHAATLHNYNNPRTPAQKEAAARMDDLYIYLRDNHPTQMYGMKNTKEMIAEGLSNPKFQQYLDSISIPNQPKATLLTLFKTLVSKLIGSFIKPDTALTKLLNDVEPLFGKERGYNYSVSEGKEPESAKAPSSAILGSKDGARTFIAYAKSKNDPNTTYTLYNTTANPKGDPGTGIPNLSREQVERFIERQGSTVVPPATDTTVSKGTPKNTTTKQVGYGTNGDLQAIAFEQKDGTWTYYESDADVRSDPDARVSKGLSKDQVQRYITARGLSPDAPTPGAVKPNSATPTAVGYDPATGFRQQFQDAEATLKNIGGDVDIASTLRNSRFDRAYKDALRKYIEPARRAGQQVVDQWGKTQAEVESLLGDLHTVERTRVKEQQFLRGNLPPAEVAAKVKDLQKKRADAEKRVADARSANPEYVRSVETELAPKIKAMSDNTIDLSAQYGLISREAAEAIKKAYDYYVPMQRGEKSTIGKAATGANVEVDRPFARMVEQMTRTIARGEQNRVRKAVLDLVRESGLVNNQTGESPVVVGPTTKIRYNPETNSLDMGTDTHVFDENSIDVYENGDRVSMTISDPSLLEALHPFRGPERKTAISAIAAVMAKVNRVISIGKTSLNPAWAPFNWVRDGLTANINLPPGVSRLKFNLELANPANWAKVFWNVGKEAFGKEPSGSYALAKDGMISHRAFIGGTDEIARETAAMFKPNTYEKGKDYASKLFDVLSIWPQSFESMTRYAMYEAARKSGLSHERAAHAAKNASVNFEQRGKSNLGAWWIFANAKIQGINALRQVAQRSPAKFALGASALALLGAAAASIGYDRSEKDKDGKSKYAKIPNYKKDSLVLFQEGAKGIPIPQEVTPFYVLGHAAKEWQLGGISKGDAASRFFTALVNNAWPGNVAQTELAGHKTNGMDFVLRAMLPSGAAPFYDVATNTNTFGSEVVPGLKDKLKRGIPKSEMGSVNENQLAVNAAKGLYKTTGVDLAPQQIKLIHNYFDPATEAGAFFRDAVLGRPEKYVGDVVNPFARKFTGKATEFYDQEQFDELLAHATQAKYQAEQRGIGELSPEEQVLAKSAGMLSKVQSDANNLFKGSKLMTKDRRDLLNERKREMILDGIRRYNEARNRAGLRWETAMAKAPPFGMGDKKKAPMGGKGKGFPKADDKMAGLKKKKKKK